MQTVCDYTIFTMEYHAHEELNRQEEEESPTMSLAEFRLQCQVLLGGLAASAIMLLGIYLFGL